MLCSGIDPRPAFGPLLARRTPPLEPSHRSFGKSDSLTFHLTLFFFRASACFKEDEPVEAGEGEGAPLSERSNADILFLRPPQLAFQKATGEAGLLLLRKEGNESPLPVSKYYSSLSFTIFERRSCPTAIRKSTCQRTPRAAFPRFLRK